MSTDHQDVNDEEKKNVSNIQRYQRVADRVQQWNRAIPEAGYITLGTIRYGVRFSTGNYPFAYSSSKSSKNNNNDHVNSSSSVRSSNIDNNNASSCSITPSRSGSSDCSTNSSNNHNSCCCIKTSNIGLPWTTNYARTKIPLQPNNPTKNRIFSASKSSSFSLAAMSAPDSPSLSSAVIVSSTPVSAATAMLVNRDLQTHTKNVSNTTTTISNTITLSSSVADTRSMKTPLTPTFHVVSKFDRNNPLNEKDTEKSSPVLKSPLPVEIVHTTTSTTSHTVSSSSVVVSSNKNTVYDRSCDSRSYPTIACCQILNSSSSSAVSVEQCRDRESSPNSLSSLSKSTSSICCYTIASQSRAISKQINRSNNLKRIPRSIVQQHGLNPSSKSVTASSPSSFSIFLSSKNSSGKVPPPIPPRPHHTNTSNTEITDNFDEDESVNPVHFRRKLQKFEQQCSNLSNNKNNSGNNNNNNSNNNFDHQQQHNTNNRFEFFGCFSNSGSGDQVNSEQSSSDYCSSSNSEKNNVFNQSGDNQEILRAKKFNSKSSLGNNSGVNQSIINQNGDGSNQLSKRNLRFNNNKSTQDVVSNNKNNNNNNNNNNYKNSTNNLVKVKSLGEVPSVLSSATSNTTSTAAAVVIRKLTPKLARKPFKFGDHLHTARGNSEDRLLDQSSSGDNKNQNLNSNTNKINLSNRIGCYGGSFEDDSDIGFIDSSGGEIDNSSSLSDIDPISTKSKVISSSSSVQQSVPSLLPIKSHTNYCNLSFDSVPKILNSIKINSNNNSDRNNDRNDSHHNTNKVNTSLYDSSSSNDNLDYTHNNHTNNRSENSNNNNTQSLLAKDLFSDSLTDIDKTSTISYLSEDNICCDCSNYNTNSNRSLDSCLLRKSQTTCFCNSRRSVRATDIGNNYDFENRKNYKYCESLLDCSSISSPPLPPLPDKPPPLPPPYTSASSSLSSLSTSPTTSYLIGSTGTTARGHVKGPVFKRIPAIESFGYINKTQQIYARNSQDKELMMERRRNTLDRLQRLGFGRRSSPSPTQQGSDSKSRKSSEKSERLKELTELLKGNHHRKSPTPPPIPPPRKLRHTSSLEKTIENEPISFTDSANTDDILHMDEETEDENIPDSVKRKSDEYSQLKNNDGTKSAEILINFKTPPTLLNALKPNTSVSNLESIILRKDKSKSPSPSPSPIPLKDDNLFSKLPRPESKTIIGSYTQKTIPFRSASFSQIDYSSTSGKYIKSALGAIRDKLRSNKESSVVENTNLTLPRKKDDTRNQNTKKIHRSNTSDLEKENQINLLKKSELNISLNFEPENERFSLEEIVNPPDVILEEEVSSESDRHNLSQSKEKISSTTEQPFLSDNMITESLEIIPKPVEEKDLPEECLDDIILEATDENSVKIQMLNEENTEEVKVDLFDENLENQHETSLAILAEENIPLESPPENFLQTATTCLIPVPVYECVAGEWNAENSSEQWLDMASEEIGLSPEIIMPLNTSDIADSSRNKSIENKLNSIENRNSDELKSLPSLAVELLPTISISQESLSTMSTEEKLAKEKILSRSNTEEENSTEDSHNKTIENKTIEDVSVLRNTEFVEVKKRYSNDDLKIGERTQSTDSSASRGSEEKRRLDKSRRRKGMYIQWPTIDKNVDLENPDWGESSTSETPGEFGEGRPTLDFTKVNFSEIGQTLDSATDPLSSLSGSRPSEDKGTPGSMGTFDPLTPESDYNRPIWPKNNRRSSLSCQSSEEKDDMPSAASSSQRSIRNAMFLRTDSTSDNESDRTRASPSPAPGEQDFRRYSKRPLRGPYGQMLEAEMKKPAKMYYDEILEELKTPESAESLSPPIQNFSIPPSHSFDESQSLHHQQSKFGRNRKNNVAYLPIPIHTRAASTPSQMETTTTTTASMDNYTPNHKRHQSTSDTISLLENPLHTRTKAEAKKFSLDSNRDRSPKRASSEVPDTKHQHAKRSSSTASEKQQKRSLDEVRLSQASRTPSERSMVSESGKQSGNLMPTPELLAELLKGSSERLISEQRQQMFADTRTLVVQEIYRNEQSYVDSLQIVVMKYFNVLKTPEYAGMIDSKTVDEIFYMIPEILSIHEKFLNELKARLDSWDAQQKVGDAFHETFSKTEVLETYTSFVNNCNRAKDAIKTTSQQRPSFARFLESTAREHKGKLSLDNLLIKPVQKFPNYEMLFTRLIKHTDIDHPDQKPLQDVLKLVHDILVHINCKEKEILENGQREATLRELEGIIEGITELVAPERQFLLFDLVSMPTGQGARKERGFFLFSDLLVITSIKRRSGTIRKPNTITCPGSVASTLDTNKYKFLTKVPLDSLEIVKTKDENVKRIMNEIEQLADDCNKLQQIAEITNTLKYPHQLLEETIRDLHREVQRQLSERQSNDTQLNILELTVNSSNGSQKLTIVFSKAEKRSQWEEAFNEAKQKLAASLERHPIPEFLMSIPIRKTRAGLQFTCAAPTLSSQKDVWVCNSDGYVGQVCVLSIVPEPNVTSCNGVCNARILCVASVPAQNEIKTNRTSITIDETSKHSHSPRSSNSSNCQTVVIGSNQDSIVITNNGEDSVGGGGNISGSGNNNSERKKTSNQSDTGSDMQLDSNSSSDDSEPENTTTIATAGQQQERVPSPAQKIPITTATVTTSVSCTPQHHQQDSNPADETDNQQSTMWLGTEDGCIHVYNCTDNIRIKKNKIKIQHVSAVYSILYLDNRVFVALANGDICVYLRENGSWNTTSPLCISIGSVTSPVSKLLNVHGKLWCSIQGIIKVLDTKTLQVENQIQISSDSKPITNMVVSSNYVWVSIQNSAHIKCFHSNTHDLIFEVNLAPSVNKMLSNCDDIIRQHKAACLRVTSLLACKDLIWIGTSAGVLLTIPAQGYNNVGQQQQQQQQQHNQQNQNNMPILTGIPHGHTGHVRFLAYVDKDGTECSDNDNNLDIKNNRHSIHKKTKSETGKILIISGGDGYEDFRCSGANTMSEVAGREDSTNHLLLWQM